MGDAWRMDGEHTIDSKAGAHQRMHCPRRPLPALPRNLECAEQSDRWVVVRCGVPPGRTRQLDRLANGQRRDAEFGALPEHEFFFRVRTDDRRGERHRPKVRQLSDGQAVSDEALSFRQPL
jgi:hypothetical protein